MDPFRVPVFGVSGTVWLWLLAIPAFGIFGWRVGRLVGLLRQARPENRLDRPLERLRRFAVFVLGQKRLFQEWIGTAHFFFFWGFVFYAGTFGWTLLRGLLPWLPLPYPDDIGVIALVLDVMAVLVLASIAVAVVRRLFFPPAHLHQSRDAFVILGLIGMLMVTQLLAKAFDAAGAGGVRQAWTPAASLLATALAGLPSGTASRLAAGMQWLHVATVLVFLSYLPYSKHLHLLVSPFNVFFSNLRQPGDLGAAGEDETAMAGATHWRELTWRQLLSSLACAECGRCDRICAAFSSGRGLSPQELLRLLKEHLLQDGLTHKNGNGAPGPRALIGDVISPDIIWGCAACMGCMERCPVLNEHVPLLTQLRRALVSRGEVSGSLQESLTNLTRYGNSLGKSPRLRGKWTKDLPFKVKDARKQPVEYLWFVGDYASFDPRLEEITRATARILETAGVDFGIIYDGEQNSGNDVRRVGEEGLFGMLRDKNLAALEKASYAKLLTTDPHSYNTLKNEYFSDQAPVGGNGQRRPVLHYTELLDQLIRQGKLSPARRLDYTVTYQDPCYLGRYNHVYEPPRRVLRALGVQLVELPRHHADSFCCGAGGGRIWMEDKPGAGERPAEVRMREAAALPGVQTLVVACPKDLVMFRDAIKTTGIEGKLVVKELAELVWEAMQ